MYRTRSSVNLIKSGSPPQHSGKVQKLLSVSIFKPHGLPSGSIYTQQQNSVKQYKEQKVKPVVKKSMLAWQSNSLNKNNNIATKKSSQNGPSQQQTLQISNNHQSFSPDRKKKFKITTIKNIYMPSQQASQQMSTCSNGFGSSFS